MLTDLQKKTAEAIVNIFETGSVRGDYGKVTLLASDAGHLTYGRSQTTLASGNLYLLIKAYCEEPQAKFAAQLKKYLSRLKAIDFGLDIDTGFKGLLELSASDPIMKITQDGFFDRVYWMPAVASAEGLAITSPLGTSVVYDSTVHGSWRRIRDKVNADAGTPKDVGEKTWIGRYVQTRTDWLANHPNTLLHRTVYRMEAFRELIAAGKWDLPLPLVVRGKTIDRNILTDEEPIRVSASDGTRRNLMLQSPRMKGDDVKQLQRALTRAGLSTKTDGVFGPGTDKVVKQFQKQRGLKPDGIVGQATRTALGM